jgi:TolA-binding protein
MQYLNHVPESSGDELEIQFQNVSLNLFSVESVLNEHQIVTAAKSSKIVPLLDARYEQRSADRGVIIIRFSRRVDYSVQAGADRRHITITILTPEIEKAPPEPSGELPPVTRPTDLQQPDIKPTLPAVPDEKIAALMEEARQAVASGNNNRAVQLYTKVLQYPDNPYRQDALEFLGVARERKGQVAHAIKEYQRYLALYPEGEGAERVKQRLVSLTTAADKPRTTEPGTRRTEEAVPWDVYGGLSQFYRRNEVTTDDTGNSVTQSSLSTDMDITARRRSSDYDLQSRFTGSYLNDFLDDGPGSESSVSSLYFDANSKPLGLSMRLGRQSRNTGGVLGRFDGLLAGYKMTDWLTINAVGGYPVFSSRDNFNTDKYLYGISADIGTLANAWDFNAFIIEQRVHNIVDRRAIGGETRYFDSVRSILTFVDYDIFYNSLNTFIFLGTWTLPGRTTINATLDYRNSPLLTTSSALQGQTVDTIGAALRPYRIPGMNIFTTSS